MHIYIAEFGFAEWLGCQAAIMESEKVCKGPPLDDLYATNDRLYSVNI